MSALEYLAVASYMAKAVRHVSDRKARRLIAEQIADFLEAHYDEFDERGWMSACREG